MRSTSCWLIKIVSRPSAAGGGGQRSRSPPRHQRAVSSSQRGRLRRMRLRQQPPTSTEAEQEVEETYPVEAAGDAEEQPDAADPGSEVFILQFHPVDEGLNLPASGWADCPSSPVVSTGHVLLPPFINISQPGHTHWCLLPSASFSTRSRTKTHPPPSRATCE